MVTGGWTPASRAATAGTTAKAARWRRRSGTAAVELERGDARSRLGARWSWTDARVAPAQGDGTRERGRAQWAAVRWEGPFGAGRLEATVGLGRHDAIARTVVAPSLAWRFTGVPWAGRVVLERLATPVWTDLAPGERPFLQDTWVAGLEVGSHGARRGRAGLSFLTRLPLESLALRAGYRADPHVYDFGLLAAEALWRSPCVAGGIEGFVLARDASPLQPAVDPGRGGRAFVEATATMFQGDLRARPRIEAWGVGPRESEAAPSRALPGYVTFTAGLELSLADAGLLIEGRNLEGRARPQTWVDPITGTEALGPGRELRLTFTWRFWD
jgi:hypothetical protein